ncbi:MAG TPA: membrane protein insertion efficiency factor YidD, partial [Campylobacterales bacterium]|nr:membrane protein insertion efficiency factor YidD [Campylobacterales bacterium]
MRKAAIAFVHFYQKFLSPITVGSCRYYPSCSEYAIWQF